MARGAARGGGTRCRISSGRSAGSARACPFHGSAHLAVPAAAAEAWIARLLALPMPRRELVFPLAQLARRSGDRVRDVPDDVRARVARRARRGRRAGETLRAVREVAEASAEEEQRIFGESLPPGLRLVEEEPAA